MTTQAETYLETIARQGHGTQPDAPITDSRGVAEVPWFSLFRAGGNTIMLEAKTFVAGSAASPPFDTFDWVDPVGEMRTTITQLEARVAALEKNLQSLRASSLEEVIVLRTMNKEQAKQEALALFQEGKPLLYSDVARALRIDLATAVEVCDELISVGEVEESGDSNQSR